MTSAASKIITRKTEEELESGVSEFLSRFSYDNFLGISYTVPVKGNGALYSAIIVYKKVSVEDEKQVL